MHFDHGENKIRIFNFWPFPYRLCRGSGVRVGSEDNFKIFLKGVFVQEGSSGTRFDHGQYKIKTFPFYTPPYYRIISPSH